MPSGIIGNFALRGTVLYVLFNCLENVIPEKEECVVLTGVIVLFRMLQRVERAVDSASAVRHHLIRHQLHLHLGVALARLDVGLR